MEKKFLFSFSGKSLIFIRCKAMVCPWLVTIIYMKKGVCIFVPVTVTMYYLLQLCIMRCTKCRVSALNNFNIQTSKFQPTPGRIFSFYFYTIRRHVTLSNFWIWRCVTQKWAKWELPLRPKKVTSLFKQPQQASSVRNLIAYERLKEAQYTEPNTNLNYRFA